MTDTPFNVFTAPNFEKVAGAFKANFEEGLDHGAQFCVFQNGALIVDLQGGWADRRAERPVTNDTLFSVFSSGKAAAALVIAHLADQDRLGYNQLVSTIWPEFAAHGKGDLSIAQVLSHQSGLSGITDPDWAPEDWYDWDKTCAKLAAQEPLFPPGSVSGYHPVTFGFLTGEIARRTDKDMRSLGRILREDLCAPNNIDVWIGLPEDEHHRCAAMQKPKALADLGEMNPATRAAFVTKQATPGGRPVSDWRKAEFAGSNCHATAKGLARIMQMAVDGNIGETKYLSEDIVLSFRQSRISGRDLVLPFDVNFATGVMLNTPNYFYGPNAETIGHSGWGGSCVFADPRTGLHGAYVMNRQDNSLLGDLRPRRIIDALYDCL